MRLRMALGSAAVGVSVFLALVAPVPAAPAAATSADEVDYHDLANQDGEIFMEVAATRSEIGAVRKKLRHYPAVQQFAYLDHHDALAEARRIFKDDEDLVKTLTADILPVSFRVRLRSDVDRDTFTQQFELQAGVDEVKLRKTKAEKREAAKTAAINHACRGDVDAEVFMTVNATIAQENAVAAVLADTDGVESVERVSHDGAAATYACLFPDLRVPAAESLPASFRLRIRSFTVVLDLEETVGTMPGVDEIKY
jgi:cell division protein FtsX